MGRETRRRFKREGIYVYLWVIHVEVWQKTSKLCKAIILPLKNKLKKEVQIYLLMDQAQHPHMGWCSCGSFWWLQGESVSLCFPAVVLPPPGKYTTASPAYTWIIQEHLLISEAYFNCNFKCFMSCKINYWQVLGERCGNFGGRC